MQGSGREVDGSGGTMKVTATRRGGEATGRRGEATGRGGEATGRGGEATAARCCSLADLSGCLGSGFLGESTGVSATGGVSGMLSLAVIGAIGVLASDVIWLASTGVFVSGRF